MLQLAFEGLVLALGSMIILALSHGRIKVGEARSLGKGPPEVQGGAVFYHADSQCWIYRNYVGLISLLAVLLAYWRLPQSSALVFTSMRTNPLVNTDVRGRAAMCVGCPARGGYQARSRSRNSGHIMGRMSNLFDELQKRARALTPQEKAALARMLIDELDATVESGVEQLWVEEAHRRYDAYLRGELRQIPGDEAIARARNSLK